MDFALTADGIAPILALLIAPIVGSFLGVLIRRVPAGLPILIARSACDHCHTPLGPSDLVPLLSYAALRGRCRHCGQPIGIFYPLVEIAAAIAAAWVICVHQGGGVWISCGLGWTLLTLSWIDVATLTLPDLLTLPLLAAGLLVTWLTQPDALTDHALAAILAYSSFWLLATVYRHLRGWDGLGGGDLKLLAAAGAWCGVQPLPFIVLTSACLGLLFALGTAIRHRSLSMQMRIPFGPCLAAAFWLAWLYPDLPATPLL
jgi:leader peptidase (prepilin peptidase) / N-methyltransferase